MASSACKTNHSYVPGNTETVVLEEESKTYVEADYTEIFGEFEVRKGAELYITNNNF